MNNNTCMNRGTITSTLSIIGQHLDHSLHRKQSTTNASAGDLPIILPIHLCATSFLGLL